MIIRRTVPCSFRERIAIVLLAFTGIVVDAVEIVSLGYLTSDLYTDFLFSDTIDWIRGEKR